MTPAQRIMWESAAPYLFMTPEEWLSKVDHWEFGLESRNRIGITGAYMISPEGEIHISVTKRGYGITMRKFRELLNRYGRLTTRLPKWMDDEVPLRLGFKKVGEDELDNHFEIERGELCQQ